MARKLMLVSEYRDTRFTENSRPSINTLKKWIRDGSLPGKRLGNLYYVDAEAEEHEETGDEELDALLARIKEDNGGKSKKASQSNA